MPIRAAYHPKPHHKMTNDYIPSPDFEAAAWATNFATVGDANQGLYKISIGTAAILVTIASAYASALAIATEPATRTAATVQAKNDARATMESTFRPVATAISIDASIDSAAKITIGATVKSPTRTPVPAPSVAPALAMKSLNLGVALLSITNSTTDSRSKPPGATGTQIAVSVGTAFTNDPTTATVRDTATKAAYALRLPQGSSGMKVTAFARYCTRSGPGGAAQTGPWSAPLQFHAP